MMLPCWILLLYCLAVVFGQVAVDFELVRYNDETLTQEQLKNAFETLGLHDPTAYHLKTIDLNAVILQGQCQPGWYWASNQCLQCQCLVRVQSTELSIWFEPL